MGGCNHPKLVFNSGGFYVRCLACGAFWVAKRGGQDADLDYDRRGPTDVVYEPATPPSPVREAM